MSTTEKTLADLKVGDKAIYPTRILDILSKMPEVHVRPIAMRGVMAINELFTSVVGKLDSVTQMIEALGTGTPSQIAIDRGIETLEQYGSDHEALVAAFGSTVMDFLYYTLPTSEFMYYEDIFAGVQCLYGARQYHERIALAMCSALPLATLEAINALLPKEEGE